MLNVIPKIVLIISERDSRKKKGIKSDSKGWSVERLKYRYQSFLNELFSIVLYLVTGEPPAGCSVLGRMGYLKQLHIIPFSFYHLKKLVPIGIRVPGVNINWVKSTEPFRIRARHSKSVTAWP